MKRKTAKNKIREAFNKWIVKGGEHLPGYNEFMQEVNQVLKEFEQANKKKYSKLPDSIQEALNTGDGVYRP